MAGTTMLENLINPEVLADMVTADMERKIKFSPLAVVGTKLQNGPGDTLTMPKYEFVGEAEDVAEGAAIPIEQLTTKSTKVTVKKVAKGIELTDEAVLSAYGDPVEEARKQLSSAIAYKIDSDCIAALNTAKAPYLQGDGTALLDAATVATAKVKFGENIDDPSILFITPAQYAEFLKDQNFIDISKMTEAVLMSGVVGKIYGCQVVVSSGCPVASGKVSNFIVQAGALGIEMKRNVQIETDRDITYKKTLIVADQHYVAYLRDVTKCVKILAKQPS
jgi:N4-gp56 family major capsid protein